MFALDQKELLCVLFIDKIDAIGLKRGHSAQREGKFYSGRALRVQIRSGLKTIEIRVQRKVLLNKPKWT